MSNRLSYRLLGIALAITIWEIVGRVLGDRLFAPFSVVVGQLGELLVDGKTLPILALSLGRMLIGYALGCLIGMPLGILMGRSRLADRLLHPWVSMMVVLSVAALVPLLIVLCGTAFHTMVVFLACIWYITLTAYQGARGLDERYLRVGRSFAASPWTTFHTIHLPALFPYLMTGARVGLTHAIRAMVMAEMYVMVGFGRLVKQTGLDLSTARILAYLLLLMIVSIGATALLRWSGQRLAPWYSERLNNAG